MAGYNPYQNVNWQTALQKTSAEHCHVSRMEKVDSFGFDIIAFSDYARLLPFDNPVFPEDSYGSAPNYPASRFDFRGVDTGAMILPNFEVFGIPTMGHTICLGSLAGFIGHNKHLFLAEPYPDYTIYGRSIWDEANNQMITLDYNEAWDYILDGIDDPNNVGQQIGGLLHSDGGGMFLAHSREVQSIKDSLDKDDRFLGMSLYNAHLNTQPTPHANYGYYLDEWDEILATGRKCLAFGEPDWYSTCYSKLLLSEFTEHEALKAYREGRFYVQLAWWQTTNLKFVSITDTGTEIQVVTENATNGIKIITEDGVVATSTGNTLNYTYPQTNGSPDLIYARVEAYGDIGQRIADYDENDNPIYDAYGRGYVDEIYSQAIMFKNVEDIANDSCESVVFNVENLPLTSFSLIKTAENDYKNAISLVNEYNNVVDVSTYLQRLEEVNKTIQKAKLPIFLGAGII